ncbi:MAG: Nif3-like dinuclear metal center hexameric protein [Bacteroidales bacterium]|jgi:dinuclear metal center YbgI/SA1388 family protein|nr:Nif3-like dinuclear metal center hexameric protein [Bacteroidales bacterium]
MKLKEISSYIESFAPLAYQEDYDNAGLIVGNSEMELTGALVTVDVTEEIVDEAIKKSLNLILTHHPIAFTGLKKITGKNFTERIVIKAIKNDIAIYSAHTNLDSVWGGVSSKIADKLKLKNQKILAPVSDQLFKLVYFVPIDHAEKTRKAIFETGAGTIGDYDSASFNSQGKGTFKAGQGAKPFVGNKGDLHVEDEIRIEIIFPKYLKNKVAKALIESHPYEEVAFDIYSLENNFNRVGYGIVGELENEINELDFLNGLKDSFSAKCVRHTNLLNKPVKKVAVCGGSGSFLLKNAISEKADVFVSGDFKYHQFFESEAKIVIADIGHFESEQITKELFYELLIKKFPKFAVHLTGINSNPINYL